MTIAPVNLVNHWSIEGGRLSKPYGLDVKDIDMIDGAVSFVKIDKKLSGC